MTMHAPTVGVVDRKTRGRWDEMLVCLAAAEHACDLYDATVHDPLWKELERIAPFPNLHFEIEALDGKITRYRVDPANLHAWDDHWSPVIRRNAAAIRDAWLAYRETHERLGLGAVNEESDRLSDARCSIENTMIEMPAPDRQALLWKLERLFGADAWDGGDFAPSWCADWMNAVMEDARRLLQERSGTRAICTLEGELAA